MPASVIIPAYNSEKSLGKCLESVLSQCGAGKFEVIVVDDGSTDSTAEIVRKFRGVKLLQQENAGPAAARNNGVRAAVGDIIVFTDDDCIAEKNWLKEMLAPFKDTEVSGVQGAYRTRQGELMARFSQLEIEYRYKRLRRKKFIDFIGSYSAAYRKKDFLGVGGFDTRFKIASGEDPDFSFRLSEKGKKLVFNPRAIVYHRHDVSLLKYLKTKFYRAFWRVRLYRKHKGKAVKDSYTPQLMKVRIMLLSLAAVSAILLIYPGWNPLPLLLLAIFLSTIPFTLFALRKNLALGLISPFILIARDASFLLGLAAGTAAGVWRR